MKPFLTLFALVVALAAPLSAQQNLLSSPTLATAHNVLGYVTVVSGLATGVLNPEVAGLEVHKNLGLVTAGLAASTMVLGILGHWGEFGGDLTATPPNVHALLAGVGGTLMIVSPFLAPGKLHTATGELGALAMTAGVVWSLVY